MRSWLATMYQDGLSVHAATVTRCSNAALGFESAADNPLVSALPPYLCLPLDQLRGTGPLLELLFEEAFEQRCGAAKCSAGCSNWC
ncbi:MAG TPA: cupin domain-containing protein [Lysobacter sp.]